MAIQPNLVKDGLTVQEAANLAGIPVSKIRFAVLQGYLQCGIFIEHRWKGICLPDLGGKIDWEGEAIGKDTKKYSEAVYIYKYTGISRTGGEPVVFTIPQRFVSNFWYLDFTDAWNLFASPDGIDVSLLRPFNGAAWHERDPLGFPGPSFQFWINSDNDNRHITTADIIFLTVDVVAFRQQYLTPPQEIQPDSPLSVSDGYDQRFGHSNQQVSDRGMWNQPRLKKKIDGLQRQWELLNENLNKLNKQLILETRVDEKLRLRNLIDDTQTQRDQVEEQLKHMESQLAKVDSDAKEVAGRNYDQPA